jgi:hypothetical protein
MVSITTNARMTTIKKKYQRDIQQRYAISKSIFTWQHLRIRRFNANIALISK